MREIETLEKARELIETGAVTDTAFQDLDLREMESSILKATFEKNIFLGCDLTDSMYIHLFRNNQVFPDLSVPYSCYPNKLYTKDTLYNNFNYSKPETYKSTLDKVVYDHFISMGKEADDIGETLARQLHDHSISDALYDFLENYPEKKRVAIMGGHGLSRDSLDFCQVAEIARELTIRGYLMITGGGPGAMEATHVGAWFASRPIEDLHEALKLLSEAPKYDNPLWLAKGFEVIEKYPQKQEYKSLGIPTWLYGHEAPTPFATDIAKYFANSIREEGLLAIAKGGIIFSPGSAGTLQEIFQEICQNHYKSFGYASPMIFMNRSYWCYDRPIYNAIEQMSLRGDLLNLDLGLYDSSEEIIDHIERFE